jgi:hypothetical protein
MGFDLVKLKAAISKAGQLKALADPMRVESHMPDLVDALKGIDEVFGDGFQVSDVPKLIGEVVPDLMNVAKAFKEETGPEKKAFVVDAVTTIYFYYDPDLPWIPEWIETKLEKWVVPQLASAAVEAAYKLGKKKGWWDEEESKPDAEPEPETKPDAENPPADDNAEPASDG